MGGVEHSVKATVIHNNGSAASHPVPDTRHHTPCFTPPPRYVNNWARTAGMARPTRAPPPEDVQPHRRASPQRGTGTGSQPDPLTRLPHTLSSSVPEHSRDPLLYQKFENKLTMTKIYSFSAFLPTKTCFDMPNY